MASRPPAHIAQHLERRFPRPKVDPEWLQGCYEWLIEQPGANASSQNFLGDVESQLLQSHFQDSMLAGTGLPIHITQSDHKEANTRLGGSPILVEIAAITEITHSAYQLDQIRIVREDRMRAGQTDDDEGEGDLEVEGEGPMPKYPRGMLKFELSDGTTTLSAIEYRSLPEIALGRTQLGYKMLLKNPMLRHGIAFLEPNTVELIGHQTADREAFQRTDFARGLRIRMGLPLPPPNENEDDPQQPIPPPPAVPVRSPLREISPPPEMPLNSAYNDDANLERRRRKLPSTSTTAMPTPTSTASSATLVASGNSATTSQYFSNPGISSSTGLNSLNLGLTTAQASQAPNKDSGNDDDLFSHFDDIDFFEEGDGFGIDENLPPSTSIQRRPAATSIRAENPRSITTRLLVPEESIEIISFTPSQASTRSQAKNEGRGTESAEGSRQSSTTSVIDVSAELRPDDLGDLSSSASPANRVAINTAGRRQGRPIKPLPNIRKSLPTPDSSQSHRQQSQPRSQPPLGSQSKAKEVIVIGSPSPPSLPKTARTESLPRAAGYGDIEEFDSVGDLDDEEQYDKENVPVMTRHVRRKVADTEDSSFSSGLFVSSQAGQKRAGRGDVIELSDED